MHSPTAQSQRTMAQQAKQASAPVKGHRHASSHLLLRIAAIVACCCFNGGTGGCAEARTWGDVIDHTIYAASLIDPYRTVIEDDPLDLDASLQASPTFSPSSPPVVMPSIGSVLSQAPVGNERVIPECTKSHSYLHVIRMYDSWGDGWGDTKMTISTIEDETTELADAKDVGWLNTLLRAEETKVIKPTGDVFEGSLVSGNEDLSYLCLEVGKCYDISVKGGSQWQDEVKWDIRLANDTASRNNRTSATATYNATSTLAKGRAPVDCQFSIPNRTTGAFACIFECESLTKSPTPIPSHQPSRQPTTQPSVSSNLSIAGSGTPTVPPAMTRSFTESNSSAVPSDMPSISPSTVPSGTGLLRQVGTSAPVPSSNSAKPGSAMAGNAAASDTPSTSPADGNTAMPTSGNTFMMTMYVSSMWPTNTAFPTMSLDSSDGPMSLPTVALTPSTSTSGSASKPTAPSARAPASGSGALGNSPLAPTAPKKPPTSAAATAESPSIGVGAVSPSKGNAVIKPTAPSNAGAVTKPAESPSSGVAVLKPSAPVAPFARANPPTSPSESRTSAQSAAPTVESTGGDVTVPDFDAAGAQFSSSFTPTHSYPPTSSYSPTITSFPTSSGSFSLTPSLAALVETNGERVSPTPTTEFTANGVSPMAPSVLHSGETPVPSSMFSGDVYASGDDRPTAPILGLVGANRAQTQLPTSTMGNSASLLSDTQLPTSTPITAQTSSSGVSTRSSPSSAASTPYHVESLMYLEQSAPASDPNSEITGETLLPTLMESSYDDDDTPRTMFSGGRYIGLR